jgi:hypothetical protein
VQRIAICKLFFAAWPPPGERKLAVSAVPIYARQQASETASLLAVAQK